MNYSRKILRKPVCIWIVFMIFTGIFGSISFAGEPLKAVLVPCLDDSREGDYESYLYLKQYGFRGTSWSNTGRDELSVQQMNEMYEYGWDFQLHTRWHISVSWCAALIRDALAGEKSIKMARLDCQGRRLIETPACKTELPWEYKGMSYKLWLGTGEIDYLDEEEVTIVGWEPKTATVFLKKPLKHDYLMKDQAYCRQHPETIRLDGRINKSYIEKWLGYRPEYLRTPWNSKPKTEDIYKMLRGEYLLCGAGGNGIVGHERLAWERLPNLLPFYPHFNRDIVDKVVGRGRVLLIASHSTRMINPRFWRHVKNYVDQGKLLVMTMTEAVHYARTGELPEYDPPGDWKDFHPPDWSRGSEVSIMARDPGNGLNVNSAAYQYSDDGGLTWNATWKKANCSGLNGSNDYQTITAVGIPFQEDSSSLNMVKFKIRQLSGIPGYSPGYTVKVDRTAPKAVNDLTAQGQDLPGKVDLSWTAPTDNCSGDVRYDLRYALEPIAEDRNGEIVDKSAPDWHRQELNQLQVKGDELRLRLTSNPQNIARSGRAFASYNWSNYYHMNNINDGNESSVWGVDLGMCLPQYVGIQFQSPQKVGIVKVKNADDFYFAQQWQLETWDGRWNLHTCQRGAEQGGIYQYDLDGLKTERLRVYITSPGEPQPQRSGLKGCDDPAVNLAEIEVYEPERYVSSGSMISQTVGTPHPIVSVLPSWKAVVPFGTSLGVKLSVDGGRTWLTAASGVRRIFPRAETDNQLKYRIDLATNDPSRSPVLKEFRLVYQIKETPAETFWSESTPVEGEPEPGPPGSKEKLTVSGLKRGAKYYFGLKTADRAGNISSISNSASARTP